MFWPRLLADTYVENQLMDIGNGDVHVKRVVQTARSLQASGRRDMGTALLAGIDSEREGDFHATMRTLLGDDLPNPYPISLTVKSPFGPGQTQDTSK